MAKLIIKADNLAPEAIGSTLFSPLLGAASDIEEGLRLTPYSCAG